MFHIVFDQIERLNRSCYNNFIRFNRASPLERLSFTELKMIEEFRTKHKFSILFNKSASRPIVEDELPATRSLVGAERTNLGFEAISEASNSIYAGEDSPAALHATVEHCEKNTGLRFARTTFLSTLARDDKYMEGVWFSKDPDH